jgi:hypothetical protein
MKRVRFCDGGTSDIGDVCDIGDVGEGGAFGIIMGFRAPRKATVVVRPARGWS